MAVIPIMAVRYGLMRIRLPSEAPTITRIYPQRLSHERVHRLPGHLAEKNCFNNIFVEERDFYDRWRVENGSNFGSASDNSLEPGGFVLYFQSLLHGGLLKNPACSGTNARFAPTEHRVTACGLPIRAVGTGHNL